MSARATPPTPCRQPPSQPCVQAALGFTGSAGRMHEWTPGERLSTDASRGQRDPPPPEPLHTHTCTLQGVSRDKASLSQSREEEASPASVGSRTEAPPLCTWAPDEAAEGRHGALPSAERVDRLTKGPGIRELIPTKRTVHTRAYSRPRDTLTVSAVHQQLSWAPTVLARESRLLQHSQGPRSPGQGPLVPRGASLCSGSGST